MSSIATLREIRDRSSNIILPLTLDPTNRSVVDNALSDLRVYQRDHRHLTQEERELIRETREYLDQATEWLRLNGSSQPLTAARVSNERSASLSERIKNFAKKILLGLVRCILWFWDRCCQRPSAYEGRIQEGFLARL